jgi:hypothetical protein
MPCPTQTGSAGASPSRLMLCPADQSDWLTPSRFELHPERMPLTQIELIVVDLGNVNLETHNRI